MLSDLKLTFMSQYMGIHPTRVSEKNSATEKTEKTTQYISHCVSSALVLDSRALIDLGRSREAKENFSQAWMHLFSLFVVRGILE